MSDAEPTCASPDAIVSSDLPCRDCGYNLRTLAWDGVCPKCGLGVRLSQLPVHLRFGSYRSIRRTRLGMEFWAAAYVLPAATTVVLTILVLCSSYFWNELYDRQSLPSRILRGTWYAYGYAHLASGVLYAFAVSLITTALAARRDRCNPALAWAAMGTAAAGVLAGLLNLLRLGLSARQANASSLGVTLWLLGYFGYELSRPFAWAFLAARLDPRQNRRLHLAAWLAVLVSALSVAGAALHAVAVLASAWTWATPGVVFIVEEPSWLPSLSAVSSVWDRYGETLGGLVMLLVLWRYARTLDAALRGEARSQAAG